MIADDKEIKILKEAYIYYNVRGHSGVKRILLDNGLSEERSLELIKNERSITDNNLIKIELIKDREKNSLLGEHINIKIIVIIAIILSIWVVLKLLSKSNMYSQFLNR